jgi:hypothetical protein
MSEFTFGEIDWNSGDANTGGKTQFMRLEQGTSTVRVMGNPHQFYIHWVDLPNGSKRKVNSPIADQALLRQLDEAGFKRKPRWLVKVLDRDDDEFKLLEIGSQIYNGIRALFNNSKWGKVTDYDIDVIRGKPGTNPLYSVTPNPKEKLGSEFKDSFTEFNDSVNIDAITKPADPTEVRTLLGWTEEVAEVAETASADSSGDFGFDFE